ncbi:hypothetical protein CDAR_414901, partial [Caerostris darwini]
MSHSMHSDSTLWLFCKLAYWGNIKDGDVHDDALGDDEQAHVHDGGNHDNVLGDDEQAHVHDGGDHDEGVLGVDGHDEDVLGYDVLGDDDHDEDVLGYDKQAHVHDG